MYEQSCRNVVAYNSMTHGGDGLFLWAGQSTMDTGEGGANDNLFYGNDFSFAPTNGMEATFSRNTFIANRVEGSDHGLWGGYSFDSKVIGNDFRRNRIGIAIEHGQNNEICDNRFAGDSTAISLWANPIEPSDWGYPKHRDTRSRDYTITSNLFVGRARRACARAATRAMSPNEQHTSRASTRRSCSPIRPNGRSRRRRGDAIVVGRAGLDASRRRLAASSLPPEFAQLAPPKIAGRTRSRARLRSLAAIDRRSS